MCMPGYHQVPSLIGDTEKASSNDFKSFYHAKILLSYQLNPGGYQEEQQAQPWLHWGMETHLHCISSWLSSPWAYMAQDHSNHLVWEQWQATPSSLRSRRCLWRSMRISSNWSPEITPWDGWHKTELPQVYFSFTWFMDHRFLQDGLLRKGHCSGWIGLLL